MLLNMKSMWQNTCLFEKRPELLQQTSGTMFFKAQYNFFSEFLKKSYSPWALPSKWQFEIIFFSKKLSKKFDDKIDKKSLSKKNLKINFFLQKKIYNGHFKGKADSESKKNWDRALKNIVRDFSWLSSGLFPKKQVFWLIDYQ
jgi:hypothetical protein